MTTTYMMSGALQRPEIYDYYAQIDHVYNKPKPKKILSIFNRKKDEYKTLTVFRDKNLDLLQNNHELALQYALVESCYTYVHDRSFILMSEQKKDIASRFKEHRRNFNSFFNITKFRVV